MALIDAQCKDELIDTSDPDWYELRTLGYWLGMDGVQAERLRDEAAVAGITAEELLDAVHGSHIYPKVAEWLELGDERWLASTKRLSSGTETPETVSTTSAFSLMKSPGRHTRLDLALWGARATTLLAKLAATILKVF